MENIRYNEMGILQQMVSKFKASEVSTRMVDEIKLENIQKQVTGTTDVPTYIKDNRNEKFQEIDNRILNGGKSALGSGEGLNFESLIQEYWYIGALVLGFLLIRKFF